MERSIPMKIKLFLIALILGLALPAAAEFKTISRAYEVSLMDFTAPVGVNGGLAYKECAKCDTVSTRVTPDTRYQVNGHALPLDKFRQAVARINNRDAATIVVLHHLESDTIVSVSLTI
jgi:hypothetical protein